MLRASLKHEHHIAILEFHGTLTEETGGMLPGLQQMLDKGETKIILNLADVTYVNSAGLSTFIDSYKAALRADAKVALCALQPQVLKIFKLARVEVFIPIYATEGQAFKHFGVLLKESDGPPREQILVVEAGMALGDEITRLLQAQKEQLNYRLSRVPNYTEAWRFLELRGTNVMLVEAGLPTKDAELFFRELRTHPTHRHIPVIVAARESEIADADWLIRNGADDLIRLPLTQYEISSRLRTALTLHYALMNDDGQLEKLQAGKIAGAHYEGPKYPTIH